MEVSRRNFLKAIGTAGLAMTGIPGMANKMEQAMNASGSKLMSDGGNSLTDGSNMTYRTNPVSGDRTSLLGYGCMRWPMIDNADGTGKMVDQNAVDRLVDYAIEHGVNYFDVSPMYLQWTAETAAGKALSRHPRSSYHLATKMSNHHLLKAGKKGKELYDASLEMYHHSFEALQTDHFDYYLIHNVGFENRGLPFLKERVFDNGIIDFLLKERQARRIRNIGFSYHGETKEVFEYLMERHADIHWDFAQIKMNYYDYRHAKVDLTAKQLYDELTARGIPVIIMEPLLGGKLATLPNDIGGNLKRMRPDDGIASWAFRFAASFPNVFTVLSGMTYIEHLQDNLRTFSPLEPCTEEEMEMLENVAIELERKNKI